MTVLSVVVPVYNEQGGIARTLEELLRVRREFPARVPEVASVELIVVDDGSRDKTDEVVRRFPEVKLVSHGKNRGYGAALKTGFAAATGDLLAFLDADATYPPSFLPELCRQLLLQEADIVLGSRMLGADSAMPWVRRVGNTGFALLLSLLTGYRITDSASGMRVFRRRALERLAPLPDGLDFTPAMSTRALHEGMKIREVAMPYGERLGRSKLSAVRDGWRFLMSIWDIAKLYNPLRFYGTAGAALVLAAVLLGIEPVAHYLRAREVPDFYLYRLFTIQVLLVVGLNAITFGAFANRVLSVFHPRPPEQRGLLERVLKPGLFRRFKPAGLILMAAAVLLNARTIWDYATTLHITVHWVYVLTGSVLFLTGAQLLLCSLLLEILRVREGGR